MSSNSKLGIFSQFSNELGLMIAIIAVLAFTSFVSPEYRNDPAQNAKDILQYTAMLGIFALGAGTVIIAGGIDLSSGSVIAFSGMIFCSSCLIFARWKAEAEYFAEMPQPDSAVSSTVDGAENSAQSGDATPEQTFDVSDLEIDMAHLGPKIILAALCVTIVSAFLIGSFHTWLITVIELPPFVATLASLVGLRSLAKLLIRDVTTYVDGAETSTVFIEDEMILWFGNTWWVSVVIFLVLALVLFAILNMTVVGRHLYAMGGNEEAARLSGIRTDRLKWLAYCIGTLTSSIAGVLYVSYISVSAPTNDAIGYELNAIAAAVVGGCGLAGGTGSVMGIALGSLFLIVVIDAVAKIFKSKPDDVEGTVVGILVVLAVAFNELRGSSQSKKQFFSGSLGILNACILVFLGGLITFVTSEEGQQTKAIIVSITLGVIVIMRGVYEHLPSATQRKA